MESFTKDLIIGLGRAPTIHRSHFVGAVAEMEGIMGRASSAVRDLVDAAFDRFLDDRIDVLWILTVLEDVDGSMLHRGLFAGTGGTQRSGGRRSERPRRSSGRPTSRSSRHRPRQLRGRPPRGAVHRSSRRGGLTQAEIDVVGYDWRPLRQEAGHLYIDADRTAGWRIGSHGERYFFIANPATGLWSTGDALRCGALDSARGELAAERAPPWRRSGAEMIVVAPQEPKVAMREPLATHVTVPSA